MNVNKDEINKIVVALKADDGQHLMMGSWVCNLTDEGEVDIEVDHVSYEPCRTAFCIAGWSNFLNLTSKELIQMDAVEFNAEMGRVDAAAQRLGLANEYGEADTEAHFLFTLGPYSLDEFDQMPPDIRSAAAIRVLEILRDTGEVDWVQALEDTGADRYMDLYA